MSCSIQATPTQKCHLLFGVGNFSSPRTPISNFGTRIRIPVNNTMHIAGSCRIRNSADEFRSFTRSHFGFGHLGLRSLWVSSGGAGGGSRGSGNGNSGNGGGSSGGEGGGRERGWSFLSWYLSLLAKYPVMTKAATSSFLNLVGDVICQLVYDQVPSLDLKRTFLFSFLGLVLVGPTLHFWYLFLSKLITAPGASGAFLRLLLDQLLFSPIFIGTFLAALVSFEGRLSLVIPKLRQEWFSSVLANWQLWIPFQFLNFRFVPQQFQVLAANFIALIWNVILSYKAHQEVAVK
ncbi:protein sym-1 [Dorcoceras hygrometricum]|uniref:Protein sym-1 n=1 Tax=Dorcoceras hygrometricum TaxID=472368 RepID=A0A2Z7DBT0_9LAMI|nr:protein sym-1 [Dorcoceras hygrometricum]